ncbi:hypothetical protein [Corynebacterium glutamicum]|uniref:hypothetical protein n=1 Tax=Corynebacterium glutamicum TaxID=1718 RepID=UPI00058A6502|nr:hypothetical protein [Corynebacterium glutamicum]AJE66128.1 hypothetical protein SB89_00260 [Corynebacterium glutamicum]OKX94975.1 hypothetical protein AUP72_02300 [Corynebacterium glutamicum]TWS31091.1 hypothetical protein AKJ21_13960 [Corynebacterium glutamicum]
MDVRQRINDNPLLAPVLKWDSDDGTLSGSEAALVRIVQALAADLDALDADQQQALEDLVGEIASETLEAEQAGLALLGLAYPGGWLS